MIRDALAEARNIAALTTPQAGGQGVVAQPGVQVFQFCVALIAEMPR
jgi:hypothetical protein